MANHTFTTFHYDDTDQKLAQSLFQYSKIKDKKVYAVERMAIEGLETNNHVMAEFFVVAEAERRYRQKKKVAWQTMEEFWTIERMFARSCPHWERRSVKVSVGVGLRGDTSENPIIQKLVSFHTTFDNKYKSQADGIANTIVADDYDETAQQVRAEWNNNVIVDDSVELNALKNGIGIMMALSKSIAQTRAAKDKEILDIFAKIKV
jgi:hypothetical protein